MSEPTNKRLEIAFPSFVIKEDQPGMDQGWYFQDGKEAQGPFDSFKEMEQARREYSYTEEYTEGKRTVYLEKHGQKYSVHSWYETGCEGMNEYDNEEEARRFFEEMKNLKDTIKDLKNMSKKESP
jgi:hypothetical protein